jgi:hypothetical protein
MKKKVLLIQFMYRTNWLKRHSFFSEKIKE